MRNCSFAWKASSTFPEPVATCFWIAFSAPKYFPSAAPAAPISFPLASVVLITKKEIQSLGYQSVEEILINVPGLYGSLTIM